MDFDVIVVGGGAAGLSAAVAAAGLGKKTLVYSGAGSHTSALYKAELVDNYLGIPNITGAELTDKFVAHAKNAGVEIKKGRVLQILKSEEGFFVQAESDTLTAANIVLALGVTRKPAIKGEEMFLGKGVSYCAACDGMLYRRKKVAVIAEIAEAEEEYEYLKNICGETEYFPVYDTG
ncbi:MAG: FAD-dependent oxidoreductase [Clostridiales bacterium]|jgi:thioredoxin reductase (NADPH)|nr:FAD-dependent oxidoreductase [Clostridiales bacterium]